MLKLGGLLLSEYKKKYKCWENQQSKSKKAPQIAKYTLALVAGDSYGVLQAPLVGSTDIAPGSFGYFTNPWFSGSQGSERNTFGFFQGIMEKIAYFPWIETENNNLFPWVWWKIIIFSRLKIYQRTK